MLFRWRTGSAVLHFSPSFSPLSTSLSPLAPNTVWSDSAHAAMLRHKDVIIALDGLFSYILVILYVVSKGRHYLCLFMEPYHTFMNKLTCSRMADFYWRIQFIYSYNWWPRRLKLYTQPSASSSSIRHSRAVSSRHFKTVSCFFRPCCFDLGFRVPVWLLKPRSIHSFAVNSLRFRIIFAKIRQVLTSFVTSFAFVVPPVLLSSFTPATVSPFAVNCRLRSLLRFVCCVVVELHSSHSVSIRRELSSLFSSSFCLLCCCRVALQPQC